MDAAPWNWNHGDVCMDPTKTIKQLGLENIVQEEVYTNKENQNIIYKTVIKQTEQKLDNEYQNEFDDELKFWKQGLSSNKTQEV